MGNYVNIPYKKTDRAMIGVCGLLFSAFSFVYLYVFQRDVLEALHFSLAHGKTQFAPLASAAVLTLVLVLLRWGINSLLGLKGYIRSLSYLPSFLILYALTDLGRNVYVPGYHTIWLWLLPLIIILFVGGGYWLRALFRNWLNEEGGIGGLVVSNLSILLLMCMATMLIGNTQRAFHYELEIERHLRNKDYAEALEVGKHSLEAGRTLTALRGLAMAHAGEMGEKLFQYPQYYKAEGLFFAPDQETVLRFTNDSIYRFLGKQASVSEKHMYYLRSLCYTEQGRYVALDYYLSALLLDKHLDEFAKAITDLYDEKDSLPRYYREAMFLYQIQHPASAFTSQDTLLMAKWKTYEDVQRKLGTSSEAKNQIRRKFGDTYWWYFDYQN